MKTEQLITFLISPEQTIVEAMQKIDANAKGILFITNTDRISPCIEGKQRLHRM